ncbi:unnamed protein product [Malus baccata var. baccata]
MDPPSTTRSRVDNRSYHPHNAYIGRNEPTFVFRTDPSSSCFFGVSSASTLDLDKISGRFSGKKKTAKELIWGIDINLIKGVCVHKVILLLIYI